MLGDRLFQLSDLSVAFRGADIDGGHGPEVCVLQVVGQDKSGAESVYETPHVRETVPVVPVPITVFVFYMHLCLYLSWKWFWKPSKPFN